MSKFDTESTLVPESLLKFDSNSDIDSGTILGILTLDLCVKFDYGVTLLI